MCIHYVYVYVGHRWFPGQAFNRAFLVVGTCVWLKSMVGGCRACGFSPSFGPQGTQRPDQSPAYGSKHFFFGHSDVGEAIKRKRSVWLHSVSDRMKSGTVTYAVVSVCVLIGWQPYCEVNQDKRKARKTKSKLDEFLINSHICVRCRKCYILRLETYCMQVCKHRSGHVTEVFHLKLQLVWAHEKNIEE